MLSSPNVLNRQLGSTCYKIVEVNNDFNIVGRMNNLIIGMWYLFILRNSSFKTVPVLLMLCGTIYENLCAGLNLSIYLI